ncbi:NB-ARC domain-containing [Brachionus plicatilis]|uniref:NB-ARC domain-containing n=1 Tax=Brachionus plicatilis TaxID=10195 RepID=A0A3M7RUN1_BRAPC|nr:NB-ARC domain-containing [Brachionus plicatilis]
MSFECELCFKIWHLECKLMTLTCGYVVCYDHLKQLEDHFECPICRNHQVDKHACFSMNKNQVKIKQEKYYQTIENLKNKLTEFDSIQQHLDLEPFFTKLIKKVYSRKEELISLYLDKISLHTDQMVEQINHLKIVKQNELNNLFKSLERNQLEDLLVEKFDKKIRLEDSSRCFEAKSVVLNSKMKMLTDKVSQINNLIENIKIINLNENKNDLKFDFSNFLVNLTFTSLNFDRLKFEKNIRVGQNSIWDLGVLKSGELVVITEDETIKLVDIQNPVLIKTIKQRPECNVTGRKRIKVSRHDQIITFIKDNLIVYDKNGANHTINIDTPGFISFVEICEITDRIITGHECGNINIWTINGDKLIFGGCFKDEKKIVFLKMFDQSRLLYTTKSNLIKLVNLEDLTNGSFAEIESFIGHEKNVILLEKLNEKEFVSCAKDGSMRVWNIESKSCLRAFESLNGLVVSIQKIDDARFLTFGNTGIIRVWNKGHPKCEEEMNIVNNNYKAGLIHFGKLLSSGDFVFCLSKGIISIWK